MPGTKEIKTRIKSIQGMRKVTKAMQMVSAAKMRKAQTAVLQSRTYASLAWELIGSLVPAASASISSESDESRDLSPDNKIIDSSTSVGMELLGLLRQFPKAKKVGVIVLSSNRGLVGSLNTNLMAKIKEAEVNLSLNPSPLNGEGNTKPPLKSMERGRGEVETIAELIVYGKKAKVIAQRMGKNIMADFTKLDKTITTEDIFPLAKLITDAYLTGEYQKIVIVYNHFVNTAVQKPTVKQLLPFADRVEKNVPLNPEPSPLTPQSDYLFEPDPTKVLEHLLPRIIESQIYQTILESDASEHSARMIMMKNATDAAGDLVGDLTLTYNRLRQGKITTELAEITAGRIALE